MAATPDCNGFPTGPLTGMRYNQTADNQMFRDTIRFLDPSTKECCQLDKLPRSQIAVPPTFLLQQWFKVAK